MPRQFHLGFPVLIPVLAVLVILLLRMNATLSLLVGAFVGSLVAILYQGSTTALAFNCLYNGFKGTFESEFLTFLLNRGGITFAGNSIFLRLQKNGNPVMSVFLGNVISGVVGIPFMVSAGVPDTKSFLFLLLAGFLCGFTYAAYAKASTGLSALETVLLPILDPVLNPVWVFLFLGEVPGKMAIIGAVIVLTAVFVRSIYGIRAEDHGPTAAHTS